MPSPAHDDGQLRTQRVDARRDRRGLGERAAVVFGDEDRAEVDVRAQHRRQAMLAHFEPDEVVLVAEALDRFRMCRAVVEHEYLADRLVHVHA